MNPLIAYALVAVWILTGAVLMPRTLLREADIFPWALGIGGILWAYGQFLFNVLGATLTRTPTLLAVFFVVMGTAVYRLNSRGAEHDESLSLHRTLPRGRWEYAAWVTLLFVAFTSWMEASTLPLYHVDAVLCFGLKAKALFHLGTFRAPFFFERGEVHAQPDYPLLVSYLESLYYRILGNVDDKSVKLLFWVHWLALLSLIYQGLHRRLSHRYALILTSLYSSIPLFLLDRDTQVVSGSADVILLFYWTAVILAGLRWIDSGDRGWRYVAVLFSLGCGFCKPQGVVLVAAAWLGFGIVLGYRRWKEWSGGALACLFFILPWLITTRSLPREITFPPVHLDSQLWARMATKLPDLALAIIQEPFRINNWGLYWILVIVLLVIGRRAMDRSVRFLLVMVAVQYVSYMAVYLIYPQTIQWWIASSFTRWLTHGSALLLIAAGWATDRREPGALLF